MGHVELTMDKGVAVLTIDAPTTRNALSAAMASELADHCDRIDADASVGAAVVRGAGGTFCSGAERGVLARFGEDPAEDSRYKENGLVYDAFYRVGQLQVPTIAAVRGAAVGAGMNLLMATDLRIVAEDARILAGFLRIGLHPGGGFFHLASRLAGPQAAAATGLFGEELSGREAQAVGLAWKALPAEEVDAAAMSLAATAARDPEVARAAARSFRQEAFPPGMAWAAALTFERPTQMWSLRRRHD